MKNYTVQYLEEQSERSYEGGKNAYMKIIAKRNENDRNIHIL